MTLTLPNDYQSLISFVQSRREAGDGAAWEVGDAIQGHIEELKRRAAEIEARRRAGEEFTTEDEAQIEMEFAPIRHGGKAAWLEQLAADTGYARATLRDYAACASFWEPDVRIQWEDAATITHGHYNRARRCGDFEAACDWLEQAAAGAWSVAELTKRMREDGKREPDILAESIQRALRAVARALEVEAAPRLIHDKLEAAQAILQAAQERL